MYRLFAIGLLTSVACAPLVSQRDFSDSDRYRRASGGDAAPAVTTTPRAIVVDKTVEKRPRPQPAMVPVAKPQPEPAPVLVAHEPEPDRQTDPDPVMAASEPVEAPPAERTFYAFTDDEIRTLKKRSPSFRRLLKKHRRCTKKTQRLITKREKIRDKIIHLQNLEAPTRSQLSRLKALRKKEHRMKRNTGALAACQTLEDQLTMRLRETYDATASLDY